jgi:hypothetical protein
VALCRSRRRWHAPPRSTPCDAVNLTTGGLACRARCGDIPHHGLARAAALRASASYSVVRLTPKVRHSAALLAPPSKAVRIAASFSSLMAWGRPPRFLRRLAAANPTLMRSCVKAHSYWTSAPNTLNRKTPCGVVVSICSVRERNATPRVQGRDNLQEVGERPAEAGPASTRSGNRQVGQRRAPTAGPGDHRVPHWPCPQTAGAHPPRVKQRTALQVGRLPVVVTGDLQVAYEYVRKTPPDLFSYTTEIRQNFSNRFCPMVTGRQSRASQCRQSPVSRIPKSGSSTQEAQGTLRDQDGLRKRTVSRHAVGRPYILTGRQLTPRSRGLPAMGPLARVPPWLYTYSYQ